MRVARARLRPSLSHCVETVAREEYERGLKRLLAGEGDEYLAERTELLRLFLETANFRELRSQCELHLLAGKEVTFVVYMHEGALKYDLQVA
jgi:hypothetical protein